MIATIVTLYCDCGNCHHHITGDRRDDIDDVIAEACRSGWAFSCTDIGLSAYCPDCKRFVDDKQLLEAQEGHANV